MEPRFCKDCRWCASSTPDAHTKCLHRKAGAADLYLVTGDPDDVKGYSCMAMRAGICSTGTLWEPRDAS